MSPLVNSLAKKLSAIHFQIISYLSKNNDYQEEFLLEELINAKDTDYGKLYHFETIASYMDYAHQVPLVEYDNIKGHIDKSLAGQQNILTTYDICWFAQSAGTTGASSKFIPVTRQGLQTNHFACGKDLLAWRYHENPDSKLMTGGSIILSGYTSTNPITGKANVGFISGILQKEKPRYAKHLSIIENSILEEKNRDLKMQKIIELIDQNTITSIAGVGPWIVMLLKRIEHHYQKPAREVLPDCELILSGGVPIELYEKTYLDLLPNVRVYDIYNASEGFYGFQYTNSIHDILLATHHGIFYEFIPMEEYEGQHSKVVLRLDQVKTNVQYAMVITTKSGLRRYLTGDTVVFTGTSPYTLKISGRTSFYLNNFGEQVIVSQCTHAVKKTEQSLEIRLTEFMVGTSISNNQGHHVRIIESVDVPTQNLSLSDYIDAFLQELNTYYAGKRKDSILLQKPKIVLVQEGSIASRLQSIGKFGGQHKVPQLQSDDKYINQLYDFAKQTGAILYEEV